MLWFLIITAVIIAFIAIVLFSKIKIFFEYKKLPGEKLYTDFKIKLGFISLKIPYKKNKTESKEEESAKLSKKLKNYAKTFKTVKAVYDKNRWHIRKNLIVDNFDFHLKFGSGDAASTGILTGALWSFLYGLNALIASVGILKKHYFEVTPVYTEKGLILIGNVRLSARVGSVLALALRLYKTYKKITDTSTPKNGVSEK